MADMAADTVAAFEAALDCVADTVVGFSMGAIGRTVTITRTIRAVTRIGVLAMTSMLLRQFSKPW